MTAGPVILIGLGLATLTLFPNFANAIDAQAGGANADVAPKIPRYWVYGTELPAQGQAPRRGTWILDTTYEKSTPFDHGADVQAGKATLWDHQFENPSTQASGLGVHDGTSNTLMVGEKPPGAAPSGADGSGAAIVASPGEPEAGKTFLIFVSGPNGRSPDSAPGPEPLPLQASAAQGGTAATQNGGVWKTTDGGRSAFATLGALTSVNDLFANSRGGDQGQGGFGRPVDRTGDVKNRSSAPGGADSGWIDLGAPVGSAAGSGGKSGGHAGGVNAVLGDGSVRSVRQGVGDGAAFIGQGATNPSPVGSNRTLTIGGNQTVNVRK